MKYFFQNIKGTIIDKINSPLLFNGTALISNLKSNSNDKIAVVNGVVSRFSYWLSNEISFDYNMKESQRFILQKILQCTN